jgi:hypothetical protein
MTKTIPDLVQDGAKHRIFIRVRLHALWTLEGMNKLTPELVVQALQDREAGVRENAYYSWQNFILLHGLTWLLIDCFKGG